MTPAEHQKAMTSLITDIGRDTGQRVWEVFSHWITPMHHAGLWRWRLQREPADVQAPAAVVEQPALFEVVT